MKVCTQFFSLSLGFFICLGLSPGFVSAASTPNPTIKSVKPIKVTENSVNINQANAEALSSLKGVGAKRAAAIVAYRDAHGKFQRVEDLALVPGISKHMLDKINAQNAGRVVLS